MDKIIVWFRNMRHWKTARSYRNMVSAMKRDPDYANTWQCNIAMPIYDGAKGALSHEQANKIADHLMWHLFEVRKPVDFGHREGD